MMSRVAYLKLVLCPTNDWTGQESWRILGLCHGMTVQLSWKSPTSGSYASGQVRLELRSR